MWNKAWRFVFVLTLMSAPLFAQNARSAVSLTGNDANACTTTAPCRSFDVAIAKTNAGGDIVALDSAGYGPFTVAKSISVSGAPGIHAAITATSGNAITVSAAPTDVVILRNLTLIGAGGNTGVSVGQSVGAVNLSNVTIARFSEDGLYALNASGTITVSDCRVMDNGNLGAGVSSHSTAFVRSEVAGSNIGIYVMSNAFATVSACIITKNLTGISSSSGSVAGTTSVFVDDSVVVGNGTGLWAGAISGTCQLHLSNNLVYANATGVDVSTGGVIYTYADNAIDHNNTNVGASVTLNVASKR